MNEFDICYECEANGNDYYCNEKGELVCACDECYLLNGMDKDGKQDG